MLIAPDGSLATKRQIDLTKDQCQVFVDAEPFFMQLGLAFDILCGTCRELRQPFKCEGGYDNQTFSINCACSERTYKGADLTVPSLPTWRVRPANAHRMQRVVELSKERADWLDTFELLCKTSRPSSSTPASSRWR